VTRRPAREATGTLGPPPGTPLAEPPGASVADAPSVSEVDLDAVGRVVPALVLQDQTSGLHTHLGVTFYLNRPKVAVPDPTKVVVFWPACTGTNPWALRKWSQNPGKCLDFPRWEVSFWIVVVVPGEGKLTYGEDGRRIKGWETRLTYGARLLSVALFTGGCRTVHIGFSRGAFWMTELLMRESVAVAGAIFLGGYPFPDSASISNQDALDMYTGKMPQLTQDRLLFSYPLSPRLPPPLSLIPYPHADPPFPE
jgi:hypothetical protein